MIWGSIVALVKLVRTEIALFSKKDHYLERAYDKLREDLSYRFILGLELFLAGDIVRLIAVPTIDTLIRIGAVIAVRTALVVVLNYEISKSHHERSSCKRAGFVGLIRNKLPGGRRPEG